MSQSGFVSVNVSEVIAETDKALLLCLEEDGCNHWVPRTCIADPDDYKVGDKDCVISVNENFAERNGLA